MNRTLVIGDIHGGLKALQQVLERAGVTTKDTLIFLGDYVDGWSESAGVIDFLMLLESQYKCIFIKGNHDVYAYNWLAEGKATDNWLRHGGVATINSYKQVPEQALITHIDFYERLRNYYVDVQNRLFIHAGFTSMHGPDQEFHHSMYNWDRTLWELALTMDNRIEQHSALYLKRLLLFKEIYIGHTPTLNYKQGTPMNGCNVWNIDTGAGFTGRLSIMDIDTKTFWQSDPLPELYPQEKGRS
ncbi:serine/threonine protein phosphatase [Taibaiella sp. KBW10]|uniref:metallophosphoesterase family protein n=1 Tax=Taibaiella sp. KBW10 TaxID=2153357 RepID=UPI000F592FEF|nr:metallophosphoesterase family protein [Taibaiella sp. KBW10]RQO32273.1 serine/threonine protein phosphatase [Taibaiella sp. KBW10]